MPKYLIEGSCDGGLFSESLWATDQEEAERLAVVRLNEAWGEEGEELSDLGDAASVTEYSAEDHARDAAAEMLAILRDALPHISSEVEQRKFSGNDEYFADLEAIERRMIETIRRAEGKAGPDDLAEASEGFTCSGCGRPEADCSADPCAAGLADRGA